MCLKRKANALSGTPATDVGVDRDDDGKRDERKAVVPDAALTKQEQLQEQREQRQTHLDTAATSGDHGNSNASRLFFSSLGEGA